MPSQDQGSGDPVVARGEIDAADPFRAIVTTILELVPVSHWTIARFKGNGEVDQAFSSTEAGDEFHRAKAEFALQSERSAPGPGIGPILGSLGRYSTGLALVFADSRAQFGMLTLLRDDDLGPFTSSEIRTLTFALDAASDRLSEIRLMEAEDDGLTTFRLAHATPGHASGDAVDSDVAQYILNAELEIVLAWTSENERRVAVTPLRTNLHNRLPAVLEAAVRQLTTAWTEDAATRKPGMARPVPFLVLRTRPMAGPAGLFIGVSLERSKPEHSLTDAAERFRISPREVQVLALILDGLQLNEIAEQLHIASSTVQDHIKNLLDKTATENRSEMIAKILGWS